MMSAAWRAREERAERGREQHERSWNSGSPASGAGVREGGSCARVRCGAVDLGRSGGAHGDGKRVGGFGREEGRECVGRRRANGIGVRCGERADERVGGVVRRQQGGAAVLCAVSGVSVIRTGV